MSETTRLFDDVTPQQDFSKCRPGSCQHVWGLKKEAQSIQRSISATRAAIVRFGDPDGKRAARIRDLEDRLADLQREAIEMPA